MNDQTSSPRRLCALVLALTAVLPGAWAATPIGDYLTVGGFGTLGGVVTNNDEAQFGRDRQIGGAKKDPVLDVDSNLGVQLDGKATSWLSGTVQVLAAKRDDQGFKPKFEWAYVQVKPLDGLSVRGGRMATPAFLISESRNIGYANNWVRPPNEVYALNVFHNFDGGDVTYRRSFGPVSASVTALAGQTRFQAVGFSASGHDLRGLNAEIETEWATFRVGRVKAKVNFIDLHAFDDPYSFQGYGVSVDRNDIVAQAEFVQRRSTSQGSSVNANGWYVMGGFRFNSVLPYAILSRTAPLSDAPVHPSNTQRTTAIGVRWDALKSADIKFQIDRVDTNGTEGISFTTPALGVLFPGGPPLVGGVNRKVTVFSAALDFTF